MRLAKLGLVPLARDHHHLKSAPDEHEASRHRTTGPINDKTTREKNPHIGFRVSHHPNLQYRGVRGRPCHLGAARNRSQLIPPALWPEVPPLTTPSSGGTTPALGVGMALWMLPVRSAAGGSSRPARCTYENRLHMTVRRPWRRFVRCDAGGRITARSRQ